MAKYWYIDGDGGNETYKTLSELRNHLLIVDDADKKSYNGLYAVCMGKDEVISCREIAISNRGRVTIRKQ